MNAPDLTVVIPTRNRWDLLSSRALRSALSQEGVSHEVIVVDDGSSDGTPDRLGALDDPRIRVIRHEAGGVARARNAGIAAARGKWIAFLDDDDSWSPHKLRSQLAAVRAADADFAYSGVVSVDAESRALFTFRVPPPERLPYELLAFCAIPAGPSNILVRTELIREVGGFDERLAHLADWECWIRLAWAGTAAACDDVLVAYLEHLHGMSLTLPREAFAELDYLEEKHRALGLEHGISIDRVGFAHYVAWLQLRRRQHGRAARVYLRSAAANRRWQDAIPAARFALRALVPTHRSLRDRAPTPVTRPAWLDAYR